MDLRDNLLTLVSEYTTLTTPSGWIDMWSKPFGLLAPVHEAALRGRDLGTPQHMAEYFLLPSLGMWFQAYLLVREGARGSKRPDNGSRLVRLAAGIVTLSLMARSYFSYRFHGESTV